MRTRTFRNRTLPIAAAHRGLLALLLLATLSALSQSVNPHDGATAVPSLCAYVDVHGSGAQRSDPKTGDPAMFPHGRGPQGDVIRIYNYVRLVRSGLAL